MFEFNSQRQCDADGRYGEDLRRDRSVFISIVASQTHKSRQVNKSEHVRVCVCICGSQQTDASTLFWGNQRNFILPDHVPLCLALLYNHNPSTPFQHCVTSVSLTLRPCHSARKLSLTLNQPNLFFSSNKLLRTCLAAEKVERYFTTCFCIPDNAVV